MKSSPPPRRQFRRPSVFEHAQACPMINNFVVQIRSNNFIFKQDSRGDGVDSPINPVSFTPLRPSFDKHRSSW